MLRLVVLLGAVMFVTLLIAGEDRGQMRPGLAAAVAGGGEVVVLSRPAATAPALPVVEIAPAPQIASVTPAKVVPAVAEVAPAPQPVAERTRRAEPVFTLSALPSIGGDQVSVDEASYAVDEAAAHDAPAAAGDIYVVTASSVNVRLGPSTYDGVVGKLWGGEEVRLLSPIDAEWVEVVIEGDGLRGYVASRFLVPAF
ncbi:SH3 domain-containing protein [Neotabrizicola sp. VNH66]|uniref:SH3 domain-containing protein n=1 Tax=Neotabrizicola sp. VNH66 TaxID=3400918 RepID=UPI003BFFC8DF